MSGPGQAGTDNRVWQPDAMRFMRMALRQARKAMQKDEVPVGAIVERDGVILGRGYNRREMRQDVTEHAEMMAIRQACRRLGSWRLEGCTLYVTLEPCTMCAGAIIQARIRAVVYGADDPKAGACGSVTDVFALPLNHRVIVSGGLQSKPCGDLLRAFFQARRKSAAAACQADPADYRSGVD